jgi:hypothetical protein
MDRRNFLQLAALALAGKAAERVWPFRVYSIPKEIALVPSKLDQFLMHSPEVFLPPMMLGSQILPVVSTIYGPDGSPKGYVKIESVNGKVLTCSSGVVHCKPGDLIVLEDKIYPSECHKAEPLTGTFLQGLARS